MKEKAAEPTEGGHEAKINRLVHLADLARGHALSMEMYYRAKEDALRASARALRFAKQDRYRAYKGWKNARNTTRLANQRAKRYLTRIRSWGKAHKEEVLRRLFG